MEEHLKEIRPLTDQKATAPAPPKIVP